MNRRHRVQRLVLLREKKKNLIKSLLQFIDDRTPLFSAVLVQSIHRKYDVRIRTFRFSFSAF
jgi:hypothetical protein